MDAAYYRHCIRRSIETSSMMPRDTRTHQKIQFYFQAKVVTHIIQNAPSKVTWVSSGDHSKMFEKLPHTGPVSIIEACRHKFRIALQETGSASILVNTRSGWTRWSRRQTLDDTEYPPAEGWIMLSEDTYIEMVLLILGSAMVSVGGMLFKQDKGIPMGFDDSPHMSATFFDHLDYQFVDAAVRRHDWNTARKLACMHRVADDIFCYNCPDFFEVMKTWGTIGEDSAWLHITLNDETKYSDFMGKSIGVAADMCDATISYDRFTKAVKYRLYDKLQHMQGFSTEVIRYTAADSNGPKAVLRSIVIGQMTAYAQRCKEIGHLLAACARLFVRLIGNGHNHIRIAEAIERVDLQTQYGPGPKVTSKPHWTWDDNNRTRMLALAADCHLILSGKPLAQQQAVFRGVANAQLNALIEHLKYKHKF